MDLGIITQLLRNQLGHLLETIPEQKCLVIDGDLMKPLDRIAGISFLKQHGVDKIFKLDPAQKSIPGNNRRVYFVRSNMLTMKLIADQINAGLLDKQKQNHTIILVPRKLNLCEMILESEGVLGHVTIEEFIMDLIPLDVNLMSLELPNFFRNFYLDEDSTWIHTIASSLVRLENFFGTIQSISCIGKGSKMVHELMDLMRGISDQPSSTNGDKSQISQLILLDRNVELVSPLCTPMTYEALLDETFGILCNFITFNEDITGKPQGVKLLLNSNDEIYKDIRDRHFSNVFQYLSSKIKDLQSGYDKKNDLKTVGDMKDFVSKDLKDLKTKHKSLSYHIGACEAIMKKKRKEDFEEYIKTEHGILEGIDTKENLVYIEDNMCKQVPMLSSFKLLCLLSLAQDGLASSSYKALTTTFLQSYGFEQMVNLFYLKKLGMLQEQTSGSTPVKPLAKSLQTITKTSSFRLIAKKLNLVPKSADEINLRNPNDLSYVYSGAYTPLLCKLVEQVMEKGSLSDDIGRLIPGGFVQHNNLKYTSQGGSTAKKDGVILVYFIGGCTYSEIAALRYLASTSKRNIVIATTAIITGDSFMESILEK